MGGGANYTTDTSNVISGFQAGICKVSAHILRLIGAINYKAALTVLNGIYIANYSADSL